MPFNNNIPCPELTVITNIVIKPKSGKGLFIFTPDLFTQPYPIHPMDVTVLANSKGDLKLSLLDDYQSPIYDLVLKCAQYDVRDIFVDDPILPDSVVKLYDQKEYTEILAIGSSNLNLLQEYIEMEETAYLYRETSQSYIDGWEKTDRRNGIMQYLIRKTEDDLFRLNLQPEQEDIGFHIWSMSQTLLRTRLLGMFRQRNIIGNVSPKKQQ